MEHVDLNLDNYSLNDLLALFELRVDFSTSDLRRARHVVARVHPDRSHLSGDYFSFFNKAYKLLEQVHRTQMTKEDAAAREAEGPRPEEVEYAAERDEALAAALRQYSEKSGFNRIFNELFEKHAPAAQQPTQGHGDWLSEDTPPPRHQGSREAAFARCKEEARGLVRVNNIVAANDIGGSGHSELVADDGGAFGSSTSSTLPYQDLRQAHEMSVIPVTEEQDFARRKQYSGVGELKRERENMERDATLPSLEQSRQLLAQRDAAERTAGMHRAFTLAQQQEQAQDATAQMLSGLMRLTAPGPGPGSGR
jgi:hypothetical protein